MIGGTERLLEARRAVPADPQKSIGEAEALRLTNASQPLAKGNRDRGCRKVENGTEYQKSRGAPDGVAAFRPAAMPPCARWTGPSTGKSVPAITGTPRMLLRKCVRGSGNLLAPTSPQRE